MLRVFQSVRGLSDDSVTRLDKNEDLALEMRDRTESCHDVSKLDLPISACRCARKLILFLFPWFFRSLS